MIYVRRRPKNSDLDRKAFRKNLNPGTGYLFRVVKKQAPRALFRPRDLTAFTPGSHGRGFKTGCGVAEADFLGSAPNVGAPLKVRSLCAAGIFILRLDK